MLMLEGVVSAARFISSKYHILARSSLLLFAWLFVLAVPAVAASISQGYSTTDKELQTSMIAAIGSESTDAKPLVERANTSNKGKVVGVITTIDSNLLTLTNASAQVHVTTSGDAPVYVSDVNGAIKKGDFVTTSPLSGIGMKADDTEAFVVGIALEDFKADTAKSQEVTTVQGSNRTVLVGKVRASIEPRERDIPAQKSQPFLVLFGQSLTGKSVGQTQVIVALIIFFLLLVVEGSVIYGAIHSTIISIGRNPLARTALFKQLLQVSWLALLILVFGLGALYAILWI